MAKFKIKRGDFVKVVAGKDKGKTGTVLSVLRDSHRITVEGINMVKRHQKPQGDQPGQILEKEASLHISNVSLWNKDEDRRVKVGFERVEIDGKSKKVRVDRVNSARLDA